MKKFRPRVNRWTQIHGKCIVVIFAILFIISCYGVYRLHRAREFHKEIHKRVQRLEMK